MKKILLSSNPDKLREFKRYIPEIEMKKGLDLREVNGTPIQVAIYKAIESGPGTVVEETVLEVNGREVVDIKWKINDLKHGSKAVWKTTLAWNLGDEIRIYLGLIQGTIDTTDIDPSAFGFDSVFKPNNADKTLHQMTPEEKEEHSARKNAAVDLRENRYIKSVSIDEIPEWTGSYQNEEVDQDQVNTNIIIKGKEYFKYTSPSTSPKKQFLVLKDDIDRMKNLTYASKHLEPDGDAFQATYYKIDPHTGGIRSTGGTASPSYYLQADEIMEYLMQDKDWFLKQITTGRTWFFPDEIKETLDLFFL